jgi:hypothetical protein
MRILVAAMLRCVLWVVLDLFARPAHPGLFIDIEGYPA